MEPSVWGPRLIWPSSGRCTPASMRNRVLFPEPDGPNSAVTAPFEVKSTSTRAATSEASLRYVLLTPERLDMATSFFERHGGKIIVVARFIEGLRQANGIIAGTSGMRWARFLLFNAIGAALWVATWTAIGYLSGSHLNAIYGTATRYSTYLAIALAVMAFVIIVRRVLRRRGRGLTRDRVRAPADP